MAAISTPLLSLLLCAEPVAAAPVAQPPAAEAPLSVSQRIKQDPKLLAEYRQHKRFVIAGAATTGAGAIVIIIGSLVWVSTALAEGPTPRRDYVAPIVMWSIGGAAFASGIPVAIIGGVRRSRLRKRVELSAAPAVSATMRGATFRLRF